MKHTEYMIWLFVVGLGGGLVLKTINFWAASPRLAVLANMAMVTPFAIVACMMLIALAMKPSLDKEFEEEARKYLDEEEGKVSDDG